MLKRQKDKLSLSYNAQEADKKNNFFGHRFIIAFIIQGRKQLLAGKENCVDVPAWGKEIFIKEQGALQLLFQYRIH